MEFFGFALVQLVLLFLGACVGATCMLVVRHATRDITGFARRASLIAFALPLITIFYVEAGILCCGITKYAVGKDTFVDGIYHCPLANGYQLVVIDKMPITSYLYSDAQWSRVTSTIKLCHHDRHENNSLYR